MRQRVAELWLELKPIFNRMTDEEKEWFTKFIRAYHHAHVPTLLELCCGNEELFADIREEVMYATHEFQRKTPMAAYKRKLVNGYTEADYVTKVTLNPEDALIQALDDFNDSDFSATLKEFMQ